MRNMTAVVFLIIILLRFSGIEIQTNLFNIAVAETIKNDYTVLYSILFSPLAVGFASLLLVISLVLNIKSDDINEYIIYISGRIGVGYDYTYPDGTKSTVRAELIAQKVRRWLSNYLNVAWIWFFVIAYILNVSNYNKSSIDHILFIWNIVWAAYRVMCCLLRSKIPEDTSYIVLGKSRGFKLVCVRPLRLSWRSSDNVVGLLAHRRQTQPEYYVAVRPTRKDKFETCDPYRDEIGWQTVVHTSSCDDAIKILDLMSGGLCPGRDEADKA